MTEKTRTPLETVVARPPMVVDNQATEITWQDLNDIEREIMTLLSQNKVYDAVELGENNAGDYDGRKLSLFFSAVLVQHNPRLAGMLGVTKLREMFANREPGT